MPSADDGGKGFSLRIERSMAGLVQLGGWVDGIAASLGLDAKAEYALRLCIEEAAANVVLHGAAGADAAADVVALRVEAVQDVLRVTIEDRCGGFDPLHVPTPVAPTSLQDAHVGGLGIHLMRQYTRAIGYERAGDVNRLTLTIARG
jgi:anti-sigma regulatory factor (Ser/Thr protein kinase)